jgi:hypothetical protein
MGDDDRARHATIIRERDAVPDVELEAEEGGVVADGGHQHMMVSASADDKRAYRNG